MEALVQVLARLVPPSDPGRGALLAAVWPKVVGPHMAARSRVAGYARGTLIVEVPGPEWRRELERLAPIVEAQLRHMLDRVPLRRLRVVERPDWPGEPAAAVRTAPARPDAPEAVRRSADAIADPELRALCLRTAGAYLARGRAGP